MCFERREAGECSFRRLVADWTVAPKQDGPIQRGVLGLDSMAKREIFVSVAGVGEPCELPPLNRGLACSWTPEYQTRKNRQNLEKSPKL